jgi:hypothetical protein
MTDGFVMMRDPMSRGTAVQLIGLTGRPDHSTFSGWRHCDRSHKSPLICLVSLHDNKLAIACGVLAEPVLLHCEVRGEIASLRHRAQHDAHDGFN